MTRLIVPALLTCALLGCGPGVQTTVRPGPALPSTDPVLVQLVDGANPSLRPVSLSVYETHPADPMPADPPPEVIASMRADAAASGATALHIERLESRWRHAFFGTGLAPGGGPSTGVLACAGDAYLQGVREATTKGQRCLQGLQRQRPSLAGTVSIVFQVDANGEVMRAAASPDSSRDGQAQECGVEAVYAQDYGAPVGFFCKGSVTMTLPAAP